MRNNEFEIILITYWDGPGHDASQYHIPPMMKSDEDVSSVKKFKMLVVFY